jgi:hydrogenase 3 maturation protease
MLEDLKSRLKGKVVVLGIGNTLRSDDGIGALLALRIKGKAPYTVFDAGSSPENYLGKVIREKPDTVLIVDAADFGAGAGEMRVLEASGLKAANLFSTHNASLEMAINYLQKDLPADIIILLIQPKCVSLGEKLSPEVSGALDKLEEWFCRE